MDDSVHTCTVTFRTMLPCYPTNFLTIQTKFMRIARVPVFQYLEVTLEGTFMWINHTDDIGKFPVKYLGIFSQLKNKVTSNFPKSCILHLYTQK